MPSHTHVFVDFDGTIALEDTTDLILERFAGPAWRDIEEDWVAGKIGSRECLARQIDLVRASPDALDALVDEVAIDPHFDGFVTRCRNFDLPITVISDGLDRVAKAMLARVGIDVPIFANRLEWLGEDRWRLHFPHARGNCRVLAGNCKCGVVTDTSGGLRVLIGDGRSDFCAAEAADFVIAKGQLVEHCRASEIAHLTFENFAGATIMLTNWIGARARRGQAPHPGREPVHESAFS